MGGDIPDREMMGGAQGIIRFQRCVGKRGVGSHYHGVRAAVLNSKVISFEKRD